MGDSFNSVSQDPVSGVTRIVGVGTEGAWAVDLHPMPDCECECSGIVTTADGVFYGLVTEGTALQALRDIPDGVDFACGRLDVLREQGDFTDMRPWAALPWR